MNETQIEQTNGVGRSHEKILKLCNELHNDNKLYL